MGNEKILETQKFIMRILWMKAFIQSILIINFCVFKIFYFKKILWKVYQCVDTHILQWKLENKIALYDYVYTSIIMNINFIYLSFLMF